MMDVLQILQSSGKNLLPEELDLLRAELDTGDYDAGYIASCKLLLREIAYLSKETPEEEHTPKTIPTQMVLAPETLIPENSGIPAPPPVPPERIVASDLQRIRGDKDYKSLLKKYFKESAIINESFVINNFALFKDRELSILLTCVPFSEDFLEQYFGMLDPKAIALHQLFSESFFMKHFADLDTEAVLVRGINPWRDKAMRSRQLDVFLRIKGVKL